MQKITIKGISNSEIWIDEKLDNLNRFLPKDNVIIITDENLHYHYASHFPHFPVLKIGTGEAIKTIRTVEVILNKMLELKADRDTFLLGIGGGVVSDITGFVASIYMRGVDFAFVSTSLLSQVDASVGGKNGVNFNAYKNTIGCFNQPRFVVCDTEMLKTLPQREIKSGLGEIIKHALIADAEMFDLISRESKNILNLNSNILSDLIYENIKIKSKIVEADEKELNERRKLNLGHTLGHALEKHINISHGEAVVMGIVFAAKVSFRLNYISQTDLDKIIQTIRLFDFEISCSVNKEKLIDAMIYDKKRKGDKIAFVILEKIGQAKIENIKLSILKQWIYDLC